MKSVEKVLARKFAKAVSDSLSGSDILWDVLSDHVQAELENTPHDRCNLFPNADGSLEAFIYYFGCPEPVVINLEISLPDVLSEPSFCCNVEDSKEDVQTFRAFADKISELATLAEKKLKEIE